MKNSKLRLNSFVYDASNFPEIIKRTGEEGRGLVEFLEEWLNPLTYIEVNTSGSTGIPKTIRLNKASMLHSASLTCRYFGINDTSTGLLCLPADYIAGKMMVVRALYSGMNLLFVKPSSTPFEDLHEQIDFVAITPHQFMNSWELMNEKEIGKVIVGGSAVSPVMQNMMSGMKTDFFETYGMTETCSHIALRRLNGINASAYFEVLPGIQVQLDSRGCLTILAPKLNSDLLITNDMVEFSDPLHFKWLGRFDHVINSGGIKLFPEQIERKLHLHIPSRYFITSLPDEILGEKVVLIIEGKPLEVTPALILKEQINQLLDKYERPKEILYIPEFPTSSSGKILKNQILKQLS